MSEFTSLFNEMKSCMKASNVYFVGMKNQSILYLHYTSIEKSAHRQMAYQKCLPDLKEVILALNEFLISRHIMTAHSSWSFMDSYTGMWNICLEDCTLGEFSKDKTTYIFREDTILRYLDDIEKFLSAMPDEGILKTWDFEESDGLIFASTAQKAIIKKIVFERPNILQEPDFEHKINLLAQNAPLPRLHEA